MADIASPCTLGAILAPRGHPGGPWEQQDAFEMVAYRILFDLGMILRLVYISFSGARSSKIRFFRACFQIIFLSISESKFRRLGIPNQCSRMQSNPNLE